MTITRKKLLPAALGVLVTATNSYATMAASDSLRLEEVMVTAQKREQSLADVPMSVTALSADFIKQTGTAVFADISKVSPGLYINNLSDGLGQAITIRGVGSQPYTDVLRPGVGIFIDGVPVFRLDSAFNDISDMERIEVLKGPQSTLYGKEVSAGAILFTSKKPRLEEFSGSLGAFFADDNVQRYSGAINVPMGDWFAVRASAYWHQRDGDITNILSGEEAEIETKGGRIRALGQFTDDFEAIFTYENHQNETRDGVRERTAYGQTGLAMVQSGLVTLPADPYDRKIESAVDSGRDVDTENMALHLSWAPGDAWTIESITGFQSFERTLNRGSCIAGITPEQGCIDEIGGDGAFLPLSVLPFTAGPTEGGSPGEEEQFSQEVRLTFSNDSWTSQFGAFYSDVDSKNSTSVLLVENAIPVYLPNGLPLYTTHYREQQDWSAYTHNTWRFLDEWDLVFGLNYSEIDKEEALANSVGNVFLPLPFPPPNDVIVPAVGDGAFANSPPYLTGDVQKGTWDSVSGTLKLVHRWNEDVSVYGGVATGFKPGGFNTSGQLPQWDEETSVNWEVGMKGLFFDRRLSLNMALFLQTYDDYQVQSFNPATGGLTNIFLNAAEVEIPGFEMDFRWLATENLIIDGSLAYINAEYDSYENAPCNDAQSLGLQAGCESTDIGGGLLLETQDLSGKDLSQNSPWTANLNAEYRRLFGSSGMEWFVRGEVAYRDEYYGFVNLEPAAHEDSYTLLNARAGLTAADGSWDIAIWGKNLTDEDYSGAFLPGRDGLLGVVSFPGNDLSYGIDLRYRFGSQ